MAVHEDIIQAVISKIQSLDLVGIPSAHVKAGKIATDRGDLLPGLPGILVCPFGSAAPAPADGTNLSDDLPYRVIVGIIAQGDQNQDLHRARMFDWVETIQGAFRHKRLSGVPTVYTCTIENDVRFDPRMFAKGMDASVVALRFMSREVRPE